MSAQGLGQSLIRVTDSNAATLSRPQKLGFLPTMAFWKRTDIRKPLAFFVAPGGFLGGLMVAFLGDYFPAGWGWSAVLGGIAGGFTLLYVGVLEKVIRREMKKRNARLAASEADLLGPTSPARQP
jgi:membrane associated rhomboid family serine protease